MLQPLAGIRVLDFTHVLAGPVCSRMLVDLGAEVLKVESRRRPDRAWTPAKIEELERSQAFGMVHRGKKSITLDLKHAEGTALARRLAGAADVIVENFSAGVMARLGLDYESLQPHPRGLIYVSMSGYGNDGPRKDWTSMNAILQAHSGLMMSTESEGAEPVAISNSWMDYMGGLHGCFCVLEGLSQRATTGEGRFIDLSQFECGVAALGPSLLASIVNGAPPPRLGNRSTANAPQGCYPCAGNDTWCAISVENDAQWQALGEAIAEPIWAAGERFVHVTGRIRHHDEIDAKIEAWTKQLEDEDVARRLRSAGVPAERMRTVADVLDDPGPDPAFHHLPVGGLSLLVSAPPFAAPPDAEPEFGTVARLGEHTDESLRTWLGLSAAEIERLRAAEVLV
jgi:benzylsuccinate CoA-transferase BbsF subunit